MFGGQEVCKGTRASATTSDYYAMLARDRTDLGSE